MQEHVDGGLDWYISILHTYIHKGPPPPKKKDTMHLKIISIIKTSIQIVCFKQLSHAF